MYQQMLTMTKDDATARRFLGQILMLARDYSCQLVNFQWRADIQLPNEELMHISRTRSNCHNAFIKGVHAMHTYWAANEMGVFPPFEAYDQHNRSSLANCAVELVREVSQIAVDNARELGNTVQL